MISVQPNTTGISHQNFAIKCHNNAKLSAWYYSLLDPISEDLTFDMFWSIFLYFMCISILHSLIKYVGVEFLKYLN